MKIKRQKGQVNPIYQRLKGMWYLIKSRNFILVYDINEFVEDGQKGRSISILKRTNYNAESDLLTIKGAYFMLEEKLKS